MGDTKNPEINALKKPQKMYKNLKMLQNLDKAQIEGLTEKWKNCKNVQKIENLDKTQLEFCQEFPRF